MPHSTFNIGKLFPYKYRQSVLHSVGVVYQLTCSCGEKYIGQTKRNLIMRLNEHRTCQSSKHCRHLMENPKHTVNFDSPIILNRSNYGRSSGYNVLDLRYFDITNAPHKNIKDNNIEPVKLNHCDEELQ